MVPAEDLREGLIMVDIADCRLCKRFVPLNQCNPDLRKYLENFARIYNRTVLGWCNARGKPITYYRGHCSAFLPKRRDIDQCAKITDFLKGV